MRQDLKKYLEYVRNTGGQATINNFDDDWEPIGPMVRQEIIPRYVVEDANHNLVLTHEGINELSTEGKLAHG